MKARDFSMVFMFGVAALGVFSVFYRCAPGGDGVLAQLPLEGGGAVVVTQEWSAWPEPYEVQLWHQAVPSNPWMRFMIDHETNRWRGVRLEFDESGRRVLLWSGANLRGEFDPKAATYTYRKPRSGRESMTDATFDLWSAEGESPWDLH